jgi:hypothetical protein
MDYSVYKETFINHISSHYEELQCKFKEYCRLNNYQWDWDIFQDTIVKCHELIGKRGLLNKTPYGIESYFFVSFRNNVRREKQYARNVKRDLNYSSENIGRAYEDWYNANKLTTRDKIISDLWKDYATLYIMTRVEQNFNPEYFYLFKLKTLSLMTYKQIREKTNIKSARKKILEVSDWVKHNITKEEIKTEFDEQFGEML